jgi:GNAT superfamily N-acetyltransferase
MSFIVKQATIENLDEIVSLYNEYRISDNQEPNLDGVKTFLFDCFVRMETIIFIAIEEESNGIIGFSQLFPSIASISMKRSLILNDMYIKENFRNQGVAKMLLEAVRLYAVKINAHGIGLTTEKDNNIAQLLYEKNGYKKDLNILNYYLDI